ncbi:uncharacterized protein LOC120275484 isoform X3 [Dioscorea cayenensis subsp. rotundata]|nr:uncharacterized protein LOC120275484 isoform X3 [Dioscorea cayenensis subsp. rotundata]
MAKKSRKRSKKENAGCMWGFISLFDFHRSHAPRRLLSDRTQGSGKHLDNGFSGNKFELLSDAEERQEGFEENEINEDGRIDANMASVKSLMEDEMSKPQAGSTTEVGFERPRTKLGYHTEKNRKKTGKNSKVVTDLLLNDLKDLANLDSHQSRQSNSYEGSFSDSDFASFMVDFYGNTRQVAEKRVNCNPSLESNCLPEHDSELVEKLSVIQKALSDVAEAFLTQKLVEAKRVSEKGSVCQSKQFINALETLNANRELFLKLVQDPNSVLLKHIQDLQNAHAGMLSEFDLCKNDMLGEDVGSSAQSEGSVRQNGHSFFRKKEKPKEIKQQSLNRIIVLRPNSSITQNPSITMTPNSPPRDSRKHREVSERVGSYFSLKEIKRRWKNVIGDNKERRSISMDGVLHKIPYGQKSMEKAVPSKNFSDAKRTSPKPSIVAMRRDKIKGESGSVSMRITDYREPSFYAEAKKHMVEMLNSDDDKKTFQLKKTPKSLGRVLSLPEFSTYKRFSPFQEELSPRGMMHSPKRQTKKENAVTGIQIQSDAEKAVLETDKQDGNTEIVEMINDERKVENNHFDESVELNDAQIKESSKEMPSYLVIHNAETPENLMEKCDRPSPVSVLDQCFSEDIISPHSTSVEYDSQLQLEEHALGTSLDDKEIRDAFIKAVIEKSGLSYDVISSRLLDPSLLDEIEIMYIQLIDDPQLLFDCINEVLVEINQRYFSCSPWMSIVQHEVRPIPKGMKLIQEVCKGVEWHMKLQFPMTLDQLVGKDMDRRDWMDLRLETENTITEVGDNIVEFLMEETILELWT